MIELAKPTQPRPNRPFWFWLTFWALGLFTSLCIHEWTHLDFALQDYFYNRATGTWWIPSRDMLPRMVFYLLPKWTMIALTTMLGLWLGLERLGNRHRTRPWHARLVLFICLILTPLVVGLLKRYSGVWCPSELVEYGGSHAFRLIFQSRLEGQPVGHCFPAGHASAGFAFLALYYLSPVPGRRLKLAAAGMTMGWIMGLYQMLKGAHFLTHTTTTMCIAGMIALSVAHVVRRISHEQYRL